MIKQLHPVEPEELMAYLDGELSPERNTATVAHLNECAKCQTLVDDSRGVSRAMATWQVDSSVVPDAKISAAIDAWEKEQRVRAEEKKTWLRGRRALRVAFSWKLVPVYSAVLLLLVASIRFIGSNANTAFSQLGDVDLDHAQQVGETKPSASPMAAYRSIPVKPAPGGDGNRDKLGDSVASNMPAAASGIVQKPKDETRFSFSTDGQVVNGSPKQLERLEQFAKLNRPPNAQASSSAPTAASPSGPMIIRSAELSIIAKDFGQVRTRVEQIVAKHRGYIGSLQAGGAAGAGQTLQASLRIPSDQLDGALAEIKTLGRVQSESQNGQEVTAQYVDLQARLSNARNTEQRLIDLLRNRTGKLSDVLEVETELARVRGEVEQMEAERKSLLNQVSFSALNATITEDYQAQLQVVPPSTSTRLINAAVEGYRSMVDGVLRVALFLLSAAPSILLWAGVLFFPARFAWNKFRRAE